jgi:hypothetical protein
MHALIIIFTGHGDSAGFVLLVPSCSCFKCCAYDCGEKYRLDGDIPPNPTGGGELVSETGDMGPSNRDGADLAIGVTMAMGGVECEAAMGRGEATFTVTKGDSFGRGEAAAVSEVSLRRGDATAAA